MTSTRRTFLQHAALALGGLVLLPSPLLLAAPAEKIHVVRKGDTLTSIAAAYRVTVAALRTRNRLNSSVIRVGQRLVIPGATGDSAPSVPAPSAPAANASVLAPVLAASRGLRITPGRWTHLVVHHSGIEAGNAKSYDGAHRRRGMENGLAYHFVIGNGRDSGDGQIEVGPRWTRQIYGGHVKSQAMNEHGIGICLVGNFEKRVPGSRQLASLHALLNHLRGDGLPGTSVPKVTVHRWVDRNHTVCPGRRFPYSDLKRRYGASA
ncbi:MAG: LysM peptidoglycan-binding domain-containing protein [Opitutaceae bacterium]|nr:LysM peptidoglycan-binding domain-containing protein [Opitutaceae bacterium]